jgi:amidohydrolase
MGNPIDTIAKLPTTDLFAGAESLLPAAVSMRRHLHAHPELGLHNPGTQQTVLEAIDGLGLLVRTGTNTTSVIAVLEGDHDGPTMLLRADTDALPMPEDTGLAFSSTTENTMHACGHDLHTAMLAGAAKLLHSHRRDLAGRVLFMFQPGEEGFGGADVMLQEGLLDGVGEVTGAFALHATTFIPTGHVALKGGSLMASADVIEVRVTGRGGHASAPHHALDPVPVACEIALAFQTMITRKIDVFDPAVVTIGQIVAGTTNNVIPEHADLIGTIRAVSERTRSKVHDELRRVAEGIAAAHDAAATVTIKPGYPVTINSPQYAGLTMDVARHLLGPSAVHEMPNPVMGAEDFSYVLNRVPGAMAFLGGTPPGHNPFEAAPNHSNRVMFDENTMTTGIALYTAMALQHLAR